MYYIGVMILSMYFALSKIEARGVCYDPHHAGGTASSMKKDLANIAKHFDAVRTYEAKVGGVPIGPLIADAGLKATIGIDMRKEVNGEISAAIAAAKDPRNFVLHIMVGNENLMGTSAGSILQVINRVKGELAKIGKGNIPVGTVQRPNEWLSNGIAGLNELVAGCDIIGANIYPFFAPLKQIGQGKVENLKAQWDAISRKYNGKKMVLGETGWPSQGAASFGNTASHGEASGYFREYLSNWSSGDDMYFFQYFDTAYKGGQPEIERNFGLAKSDGTLKYPEVMPKQQVKTKAPTEPPTSEPDDNDSIGSKASGGSASGRNSEDKMKSGSGSDDEVDTNLDSLADSSSSAKVIEDSSVGSTNRNKKQKEETGSLNSGSLRISISFLFPVALFLLSLNMHM